MPADYKYEVRVIRLQRALRAPKEVKEKLKGVLGRSSLSKLSKDAVDCPVMGKRVSFLICYVCPNFVRRYRGVVHCRGEPLSP